MAGGKETPRQKMIGMMYLVLTALLALNVSKSVLDAFVEIEEGTQKSNIILTERGNEFFSDVRTEFSSVTKEENEAKYNKLKYVLEKMEEVDRLTVEMINHIDKVKFNILNACGEDLSNVASGNKEAIVWNDNSNSTKDVYPSRFNLYAVQGMDQYDIPMQIMLGTDKGGTIKTVEGEGKILWNKLLAFRKELLESVGTYNWNGNKYTLKVPSLNAFESNKELDKQIKEAIRKQPINANDDFDVLTELYAELSKAERSDVRDTKDVHFMGKKFDHTPLVAAIATLSSLQQDVLSARTLAMKHWKSKVSTGDYSFNGIMPLAYGPTVVNKGDSVDVNVMMVAYDSENQPIVSLDGDEKYDVVYPNDGTGKIRMIASGNMINLAGKVAIHNKSGEKKIKNWTYSIPVMQPSGAIEIPAFNLLYRGYNNKIEISAAGYERSKLIATGASVTGSGPYNVVPNNGVRKVTLIVQGFNADGQSKELKRIEYKVSDLPKAELYWGNVLNGGRISPSEFRLFAKLPKSSPLNINYKVESWVIRINGGREMKGDGNNVSSISSIIRQAKRGDAIYVRAEIKRGNYRSKAVGTFFR